MGVFALANEHRWACPRCDLTDVTHEPQPHTRMHSCRGLAGLTTPMVPAGTRCQATAIEREDYINGDLVQVDGNGRPVMAVEITRDDGTDRAVYAPCATAGAEA